MDRDKGQMAFGIGLRLVFGLLGTASFGLGVVAVFVTENGTGTAVLLAFGGALLTLALLGSRIEAFEFGGTKLRLRAAAAERLILAEQSDRDGDTDEAERLRAQAEALLDAARPIAMEYRKVRGSLQAGKPRTHRMEAVMDQARQLAAEQSFDAAEVAHWLRRGSDEERVTALAMMQAAPSLQDFDGVLGAIADSRSAFEQYQALRLASQMIDTLDTAQRQRLAGVVKAARGLRFRQDTGRWRLSEEILDRLDPRRQDEAPDA